jgi:hypothetical protein
MTFLSMLLKNKIFLFTILSVTIFLTGCSNKTTPKVSKTEYNEDLTTVRPRYKYVEPVLKNNKAAIYPSNTSVAKNQVNNPLAVNQKLDAVLDTIAKQNKAIRYISGYRIQVYVGNVRAEADNAKSYIYQVFPDLNPYVSYAQPTYRVKVGDFIYRNDAEHYLDQIKDHYASAVIVSERVDIRSSLRISGSSEN